MRKIICKREYDTDRSTLIKKMTCGEFGDAEGFEESVYLTEEGSYFLYTNGGERSKHPTEGIKRLSRKSAEALLGAST